ncbi:hypothetical protein HDF18_24185 [Mucilaginibacter sp. X5P1]|uniref:hypothetical protein n=1 Tax=Mucilaginibacter sp. X5P1 TaxID=2723088 RepID=UPI00161EB4F2|nr:hypothetical protein [Mucilaginibacter sp. X5P1]MBB6141178.1 hypothetical protein [Mucilaginibacter sp. X5P1]
MLEKYYGTYLLYIFKHPGTSVEFIKLNTKTTTATVNVVIDELLANGYIIVDSGINLSTKGYSYLEINNLIKRSDKRKAPHIKRPPLFKRISQISLGDWSKIAALLLALITLWFEVVKPLISKFLK